MEIDLIAKSKEYIRESKFEKAQIILRRMLSENPNQAKAIELTGDLSLKLNRTSEAIQRYDNASNKYMNNNQFAEAIICLEKIVMLDKTNDEVVSRLADLYRFYGLSNKGVKTILDLCAWALNNKEDRIFISALRKIVELQPKNLPLRLSFAKVLLSINRKQDAHDALIQLKSLAEEAHDETILEELQSLLPQPDGGEELDPKSRIELGNLLYEIGSKDEAIVEFEKAVADLIATGDDEEAVSVLNRIIEIDPNNKSAAKQLQDMPGGAAIEMPEKGPAEPEPEVDEEVIAEAPVEAPVEIPEEEPAPIEESPEPQLEEGVTASEPEEKPEEVVSEPEPASTDQGMEMFRDLGQDIEGFVPATEASDEIEAPSEASVSMGETTEDSGAEDEVTQLEGQIADIEFLLKETEQISTPSFEISKQFDEFRKCISWQEEDVRKLLEIARMAYNGDLFKTAMEYVEDIREKKETWPYSLEIYGGSLIKLGRYNDAKKNLAAALMFEEIQENEKIELRYLLASSYEGLGDFDNAMREIERIISMDANYKDVREIYALLGGKELPVQEPEIAEQPRAATSVRQSTPEVQFAEPASHSTRPTLPVEQAPINQAEPQFEEPIKPAPADPEPPNQVDTYPTIIEEMPSEAVSPEPPPKVPKKQSKTPDFEEPPGENIAFL